MRILHLITTLDPGGAEKQLITLVLNQIHQGDKVEVIYLKGSGGLANELERVGCYVGTPSSTRTSLIFIRKTIEKFRPEIIHAHLPRAEIAAYLVCFGTPFVISRHNAERFWPKGNKVLSRLLSRIITARSSSVVAISKGVKDFLLQTREVSLKNSVTVVYYGYNDSLGATPRKFNERNNSVRFLCIARLTQQKDIPTLLNAFASHAKEYPTSCLTIVGEGELEAELKSIAIILGIDHKVSWVGKTTDVMSYYLSHDCLVLTSKYEGFGLVLLEAMQFGLPILATNHPVILEVLSSDYPGIFPIGNHFLLAKLMNTVAKHENIEYMSEASLSRLNHFDPKIMCTQIKAVYLNSLKK